MCVHFVIYTVILESVWKQTFNTINREQLYEMRPVKFLRLSPSLEASLVLYRPGPCMAVGSPLHLHC